ncbi:MAG: hypothetical protein IKH56_04535 [Oscillospiraceae bacterium]|nr:hypothetical protein [Oscillospiraceae bacterium]
MKLENRPDLLYSIGKIMFSIPMTAFCAMLLVAASPAFTGWMMPVTCLAAFVFSGYEIVIRALHALVRRRFLHPDILVTAACAATMALGLWQEGALGMAVYAACRSVVITEAEDTRNSVTYDSDLPGYSAEIHEKLLTMDPTPAPLERGVKKAGALFSVLALIVILALSILVPLLWRLTYREWLRRAFMLLAGASSGALSFAAANVFYKTVNLGAVHGVLYRSHSVIQQASRVTSVVFGKTGNDRYGLTVSGCFPRGVSRSELLLLAGFACVGYSEHMLEAIRAAGVLPSEMPAPEEASVRPGVGTVKTLRGRKIAAGTRRLMIEHGIPDVPEEDGPEVLHVACAGHYAGYLRFSRSGDLVDERAVTAFLDADIDRIVLLGTGDAAERSRDVQIDPRIRETFFGLTEEEAVRKMKALEQMQLNGELLAYVNDGVSAPELMNTADIRVSVGTAPEISCADILVPGTDTAAAAQGLKLCRDARREVAANLTVSGAAKIVVLVLSLAGWGGIWAVVLTDMISSLFVIPGIRTIFSRKSQK